MAVTPRSPTGSARVTFIFGKTDRRPPPGAASDSARRLVVRYKRDLAMYRAFFHVACLVITLRQL
jgi:hypothetical protein